MRNDVLLLLVVYFSFNNIRGKHCSDEHTYIIENGITIKADYWNDSRFQPEVCRLVSVTF